MKPLSNITLPLRCPNGFNRNEKLPYDNYKEALNDYIETNGRVYLDSKHYNDYGRDMFDRITPDSTSVVGKLKGFTDTHAIIESLYFMPGDCGTLEVFITLLGEKLENSIHISRIVGVYIGEKYEISNPKSNTDKQSDDSSLHKSAESIGR